MRILLQFTSFYDKDIRNGPSTLAGLMTHLGRWLSSLPGHRRQWPRAEADVQVKARLTLTSTGPSVNRKISTSTRR